MVDTHTRHQQAAQTLLASMGLQILSDERLAEYNENRFNNAGFNPGVDTSRLGWEDVSGLLKKSFYVADPSGGYVGLRRTAWYYPNGTENSDGKPMILLEDENDREITSCSTGK